MLASRMNSRFAGSIRSISSTAKRSQDAKPDTINWPEFLRLRQSQRRYGLFASIPSTLLGIFAGGSYFATLEAQPGDLVLGIDPIYAYAGATVGCAALGWVLGPTLGNAIWRTVHRRVMPAIEKKDRDFYAHITRNRANPLGQSVSNPVPDYYGEKVGSLRQYRQWLRDQNTYKRKAGYNQDVDI